MSESDSSSAPPMLTPNPESVFSVLLRILLVGLAVLRVCVVRFEDASSSLLNPFDCKLSTIGTGILTNLKNNIFGPHLSLTNVKDMHNMD